MRGREVIQVGDNGMAVVDSYTTLFGKSRFTAGIIIKEMREVTVCKALGTYDTRHEAATVASAAITNKT